MQFIAHRAGNSVEKLKAAEGRVDLVEVDVHRSHGGSAEVRHSKVLWPSRRLWERWYLLPKDEVIPSFAEIVGSASADTGLWLDLKGVRNDVVDQITALSVGRDLVVSSKSWWLLAPFASDGGVRTFRSAGNRFELALLLWLPTSVHTDGAVVNRRLLSDKMIERLRGRGQLYTWNVRDEATVEHLRDRGLDGVILDDIDLAVQG